MVQNKLNYLDMGAKAQHPNTVSAFIKGTLQEAAVTAETSSI